MILNGRDTITGDIIIMPIDISTLATTMSMMRKGMKTMKPIWKAVFSSEVTKAGMRMRMGRSSGLSTLAALPMRENRLRSAVRVCFSMKSFSGTAPRSSASLKPILFSDIGW